MLITRLKNRLRTELLRRILPNGFYFSRAGYCPCCQKATEFLSYDHWLRDGFQCVRCRSIPRNRALLDVLNKHYPNWAQLTLHESSPSGGGASERLRRECAGYVASQYFPDKGFGEMVGRFRNENLEKQTFADESFDLVITQDVLEHVYDAATVFREIARTLKPGGAHVFVVPLVNKHMSSQIWATQNPDGSPNFLHEPEFHRNPVDPHGSPVTMRWGYDIVQFIKAATGLDTAIEYLDDLDHGIRAEYIEVLVTKKPAHQIVASRS